METARTVLLVGSGGFVGAVTRYGIGLWLNPAGTGQFPVGTFFVNVTGSALLAMVMVWVGTQASMPRGVQLALGTGFFGAYTTFSTFSTETLSLYRAGDLRMALLYAVVTNVACLLAAGVGFWLAESIW